MDGTKLAMKLLTTKSHQVIDDFFNEIVSINGIMHKNLVKLKGCCVHHTQRLLVYEFLENENLAKVLWGEHHFLTLVVLNMDICNRNVV